MANSYLGGHSLHRHSWFGRSKQPAESPLEDPEEYFDTTSRLCPKRSYVYRAKAEGLSPDHDCAHLRTPAILGAAGKAGNHIAALHPAAEQLATSQHIEASTKQETPSKEEIAAARLAVRQRIEALLRERFPLAFCSPPVPLAVGIHKSLHGQMRGEISGRSLSSFLYHWTYQPEYRHALERGERRRNLDGSDAGPAFDETCARPVSDPPGASN